MEMEPERRVKGEGKGIEEGREAVSFISSLIPTAWHSHLIFFIILYTFLFDFPHLGCVYFLSLFFDTQTKVNIYFLHFLSFLHVSISPLSSPFQCQ